MRLGPLFALACVVGCKTVPSEPAGAVESPQTVDEKPEIVEPAQPELPVAKGDAEENDRDPGQLFCEKLTELMIASRGSNPDPSSRQELVETCVANARRKRSETPAVFDREVECISRASDLGAFFDCALDDPAPPRSGGDQRFGPLCEKLAKLARDEPDFPEEAKRELQDTARCAADARMEHSAAPQAFEQIERCILAASGMRAAAECTAAGLDAR